MFFLGNLCQRRWTAIKDYYVRQKKKGGTGSSAFVKKRMERLIFLEETNVIQGRYDSYFFHSYLNIVLIILIVTFILNLQHDFKY